VGCGAHCSAGFGAVVRGICPAEITGEKSFVEKVRENVEKIYLGWNVRENRRNLRIPIQDYKSPSG